MSDGVVDSLLAVAVGDRRAAIERLDAADGRTDGPAPGAGHPRLAAALARYLAADADGAVYESAEALTRFIDGGSNRQLYASLHDALARRAGELAPRELLDLGCGDGRVVAATLAPSVTTVDLVEPSGALLELAVAAVAAAANGRGIDVRAHAVTAAEFLATTSGRWDLAQSTFALHTMAATERAPVLAALRAHTSRLLIAEFDVPAFADRSAEHAAYVADRYERGLAEYDGDEVVAQGFLMPVLVGQFEPGAPRHTHEQPASAWAAELHAAGFTDVAVQPLHRYWWADAVLIEATATATATA